MIDEVRCPLYNKQISCSDCFEICMVAEHMAPRRLLDDEIKKKQNFENICMNCENHRED